MPSIPRIRRRDLLAASAAAGTAAMFPFPAIAKEKSPNEKLAIAGIGAGGQGGWDIDNCAGENIVALCDVDDRRCEGSVSASARPSDIATSARCSTRWASRSTR